MVGAHVVAIAGASGVVGRHVLREMLARENVGQVVAVGRRPLALAHPKLTSRVADVQDPEALRQVLPRGLTHAICCLGTTMKQAGSKPAFRAVDHDAVAAFARAAQQRGATRCLLVSSVGAGLRARSFYLRTKGEAEEALRRMEFAQLTVLRPSLIDDEGTREQPRIGERLLLPVARVVFSLVGRTSRFAPVRARVIARALVRLAFDPASARVRIVESEQLHQLGAAA